MALEVDGSELSALEDEIKDLRMKNNELVQKVQHWKMTAAQRENEKLDLMKENNDLRLKLSRLRSNGNVQASNLDAALQSAGEKALAHLVTASGEIVRTMELAKAYIRDRQELDAETPRWSSIGGTPTPVKKDKIHRVPPLMIGGQSIQPVVALTMLNTSIPRSTTRSPNPNRSVTDRAVPMHMLQDVYIPLTRIDARDIPSQNMETEATNMNNSTEDLGLDDSEEAEDESQQMSEDDAESSRRLDAVAEDLEPEDEEIISPRSKTENPLEGPSWMLDASTSDQSTASKSRTNLEPDSTTELEDASLEQPQETPAKKLCVQSSRASCVFTPTVRRRKRSSPPPSTPRISDQFSPRPVAARRISNSGRVLKVLVAKMSLDAAEAEGGGASPAKRGPLSLASFDAPSPNGATVPGVIVSDTHSDTDSLASGEPAGAGRGHERTQLDGTRCDSDAEPGSRVASRRSSRDSDSSGADYAEGRTRRARKVVTYKEKPLNRKLRR